MQEKRTAGTAAQLAEALHGMSSGGQPVVDLSGVDSNLIFVAGDRDKKFVRMADHMTHQANATIRTANTDINCTTASCGRQSASPSDTHKLHATCLVIKDCGHAIHLEQPEAVVHLLQSLLHGDTQVSF